MTAWLGQSCSFRLLCVSFVTVYQFLCMLVSCIFLRRVGEGNWIVLVPGHCLSFYFKDFEISKRK